MRRTLVTSFAFSLLLCTALPAFGQGLPGLGIGIGATPSAVKTKILADVSTIAAGKPFTIAVELTTHPEWHIYWSNPGDAGSSTSFNWTTPDGFKVEPLPLPLPKTFVQPGNIVSFGYSSATTYLFKVTPPATLQKDVSCQFNAAVTWLVCDKNQCVPGDAKLNLTLKVSDAAAPANAEYFAKARDLLPQPASPDAKTGVAQFERINASSGRWTIPVTFREKPAKVEAYPDCDDGTTASDIQVDLTKETPTISLNMRVLGGHVLKTNNVPVLIVYTTGRGQRRGFFTDLNLGVLGARPSNEK